MPRKGTRLPPGWHLQCPQRGTGRRNTTHGGQLEGPNKWQVVVELGVDSDAKRRRHTEIVDGSERDARRVEADLAKPAVDVTPDGTRTVKDLLEYWLNVEPGRLEASTIAECRRLARVHIIPALGHHPLHALRPGHCVQFYDDLAADLGGERDPTYPLGARSGVLARYALGLDHGQPCEAG